MITGQTGLGFNPFHAVARVAKGAGHLAVKSVTVPTKLVARGAVKAGKGIEYGVKESILIPTKFAVEITKIGTRLALRPVISRIHTLTNRRANKIAWDARKSKTPTPAERAQAKSWTKSQLNKKLPHGPLLAMLAGSRAPSPSELGAFGMSTNLGVAPAIIAALIPVFIALMNSMLKSFSKSGEAPVAIGPNGEILVPPGTDPTQPDPAAEAAAAAETATGAPDDAPGGAGGGDAADGDGGGGGGHGGKPNFMLIGGGIAVVVVIAMLMKSSGSKPAAKK